ncbi:MAG: hypothetical protein ACE5HF_06330 [Gemmatimonadota bacterium]
MTGRIEREELERGRVGEGEPPPVPRDAATLILAREREAGFEVLFLRRPEEARFAAGAYVFPGGTIDPSDGDPALLERLPAAVVEPEGAAFVAGLRELFEETGFLPADGAAEAGGGEAARRGRRALLAGRRSFAELVQSAGLSFRELRAAYHSRWITPARFRRRYDTRFFLVHSEQDRPELTGELESWLWSRPTAALEGFDRGDLPMLFPTRRTVEALAGHRSLDSAFAACRETAVVARLPRLLVTEHGVQPVLPGDEGYEEADG